MSTCQLVQTLSHVIPFKIIQSDYDELFNATDWIKILQKTLTNVDVCVNKLLLTHSTGEIILNTIDVSACTHPLIVVDITVETTPGRHANAAVIDIKNKNIELFEPHGEASWTSIVLETLGKVLPGYTYTKPTDYCPRLGPQGASGDANCASWALLYIALRLSCPSLTPTQISTWMLTNPKDILQRWNSYVYISTFSERVTEILFDDNITYYIEQYVEHHPNGWTITKQIELGKQYQEIYNMAIAKVAQHIVALDRFPPITNTGDEAKFWNESDTIEHTSSRVPLHEVKVGYRWTPEDGAYIANVDQIGIIVSDVELPSFLDVKKQTIQAGTPIFRDNERRLYIWHNGNWVNINSYYMSWEPMTGTPIMFLKPST